MFEKEEIGDFETCQCNVCVFKTNIKYNDEYLYIVESVRKKDGFTNTRFGNYLQAFGIVNTYAKLWSKKPSIKW